MGAVGTAWSLAVLALGWGSSACAPKKPSADQQQFVDSLRSLYAHPSSARPVAEASGWNQAQALRIVGEDSASLGTLTGSRLRSFLDERIRADFLADRIQFLEQRWLSDTEIALAVLVAGPSV